MKRNQLGVVLLLTLAAAASSCTTGNSSRRIAQVGQPLVPLPIEDPAPPPQPQLPPKSVVAGRPGVPAAAAGEPERQDNPDEALRFYIAQRAPDGVNIPVERMVAAREHIRNEMRHTSIALGRPSSAKAPAVASSGPSSNASSSDAPTPGAWTSVGPANVGGLTRALLVNPTKPSTMYAGASGGGVWKTTDSGVTWTPLTDLSPTTSVHSLAFDPSNTNTIYAGTGDSIGGSVTIRGQGIYATYDAGATWSVLPGTARDPNFFIVYKIVVSPRDSKRIYAATSTGIQTSADGGATFSRTLSRVAPNSGCEDLLIRTDQSTDYLFAACGRFNVPQSMVFRNIDAANSDTPWESVLALAGQGRTSLAIAPSNQSTIYALVTDVTPGSNFSQGMLGVYRSDANGDSGSWQTQASQADTNKVNWSLLSYPESVMADNCSINGKPSYTGGGFHANLISVDPTNPDRVWAGGVDLFRSDDGGKNWGIAMFWQAAAPQSAHADNHQIVFHPAYDGDKNQTIFNSSDGGIYMTSNANAALATGDRAACTPFTSKINWTSLNNGYSVTQFYDGAIFPGAAQYLAGAQDNGTLYGADSFGKTWFTERGGDGGSVLVNPNDPNELYTNYVYLSTARSTDGGNTLQSVIKGITEPSTNFLFIAPMAMDPNQTQRIYIGGRGLWQSPDRGDTWSQVAPLTTSLQGQISTIAVAPGNSQVVMYGTTGGYIFRSDSALTGDDQTPWPFSQPRSSGYVARIAIDPNDPNTAYAVYRTFKGLNQNYVYKTSDAGVTWTSLDGSGSGALPDGPVHSIVIDPTNTQTLYVGTEYGIFTSVDGGNSWMADANNFADVPVTQLILDRSAGAATLIAFTYGRGVWKTTIPGSGTPCTYDVGASLNMSAAGEDLTTTVKTASGCVWSVTPYSGWLFGRSPAIGTGPGDARIYGTWNTTTTARTGYITVANAAVKVAQKGAISVTGNDQVAYSIASLPFAGIEDTRGLTSGANDPVHSCTNSADFKTAWWTFTAPADGTAVIKVQGERFDVFGSSGVVLTVYDTDRTADKELGCTTVPRNTTAWIPTTLKIPVTKGKAYQIEVSATGGTTVDGGFTILSVVLQ